MEMTRCSHMLHFQLSTAFEVNRSCNRNNNVGDDKPECRYRSHPAVNIEISRAIQGKDCRRNKCNDGSYRHCLVGSRIGFMRITGRVVKNAMAAHQKQNTCGSIDAGQNACKKTDDGTNVDKKTKRGEARLVSKNIEGCRTFVKRDAVSLEPDHLRIGGKNKNSADNHCASDYRSGNIVQWILGFRAKRCGTFKTGKTEQGKNKTAAKRIKRGRFQGKLIEIKLEPIVVKRNSDKNKNKGNRCKLEDKRQLG